MSTQEPVELVCARCRLKVNSVDMPGGKEYIHAGAVDYARGPGAPDHKPEPAVMPPGSAGLTCDFCDATHPQWAIPLADRPEVTIDVPGTGFKVATREIGWWAACQECADLVAERKIRLLRQRSLETMAAVTGRDVPPGVAEMIRMRQAAFWMAGPGPAVPMIRG